MELPLYRCHKLVRAAKILGFTTEPDPLGGHFDITGIVTLELDGHPPVKVREEQLRGLKVGGYYVRYEDGYESFSPAKAFEEGYTLIEPRSPCEGCGE